MTDESEVWLCPGFPMLAQPTESTCGPTSLHAVYRYYGDKVALSQVIDEVATLGTGGTLSSLLGLHALKRGYRATLYTCNLQVFDPTWFKPGSPPLPEMLRRQMQVKSDPKLQVASQAYIDFISHGGEVRMEDISSSLLRRPLNRQVPVLTGLSLTWLYRDPREVVGTTRPDSVLGEPCGHFVVLYGYDRPRRRVLVADPYLANPLADGHHYEISIERVLCAILLGIVTYDANLLIIEPPRK